MTEEETTNYEVRHQGKILKYKEDDEQVWFKSPFKEGKTTTEKLAFGHTLDRTEILVDGVVMGYLCVARQPNGKFIQEGFEPLDFMDKHVI